MGIVNSYLSPGAYIDAATAAGQSQRKSANFDAQQEANRRKEELAIAQQNRLEAQKFETDEAARLAKINEPLVESRLQKSEDIKTKGALEQRAGEIEQNQKVAEVERQREQQHQKDIANITDTEIEGLNIPPEYKDVLKTAARMKVQTGMDATKLLVDQYDEQRRRRDATDYQRQVKEQTGIQVADADAMAVVEGHQQSILGELAKRQITQKWAQEQAISVRDELSATIASVMADERVPDEYKGAAIKALVESKFKDLEMKFQLASAAQNATDALLEKYFATPKVTPQNPTEASKPGVRGLLDMSLAELSGVEIRGSSLPAAFAPSNPQGFGAQGLYVPSRPADSGPVVTAPKPGSKGPITKALAQQYFDQTDPKLSKNDRIKAAQLRAAQEGYTL
jgi:hypothetical protein